MSKHSCPIDAAQQRTEELTEEAIKAARSLVPEAKSEITQDDLECTQCGMPDSIHPARAAKGYDTCIDCARENERQSKLYNRRASRSYDYDD